jgi:hypothetical protein
MYYLYVSCFIFILKHETQQWWGAGAMFFSTPPHSSLLKHNNNKKGKHDQCIRGRKGAKNKGRRREEGVFTANLKGMKMTMAGANIPYRSFLHNRTT